MKMKIDTVLVRIYLEGVLFPYAKSLTVTEYEGGVRCQMGLPPSVKLRPEEWVGASCHIFYANQRVLDQRGGDSTGLPLGQGWPILFQGELMGESTNNTVQSEHVMLTFVSQSRHFDQTLLYFWDPQSKSTNHTLAAKSQATFIGNTTIAYDVDGVLSRENALTQILTEKIRQMGDTREGRNIAFTSTMLDILKSAKDRHPMFDYFDRKFKLTQRFAAYADPDVVNIMTLTSLQKLMDKRMSKLPQYASIKQMMEIGTGVMQYNWNQLAQPKYRQGQDYTENVSGEEISQLPGKIEEVVDAIKRRTDDPNTIQIPFFKSQAYLLPTDFKLPHEFVAVRNQILSKREFIDKVYLSAKDIIKVNDNEDRAVALALYKTLNSGYYFEESDKDSQDESKVQAKTPTQAKSEQVSKESVQASLNYEQDQARYRDEINEFIVTPNMRFSHPPKCNVFVPYSFVGYGINRNHMQEITRLYATVKVAPSPSKTKEGLIEWYIAPISQGYHLLEEGQAGDLTQEYKRLMERNKIIEQEEAQDAE